MRTTCVRIALLRIIDKHLVRDLPQSVPYKWILDEPFLHHLEMLHQRSLLRSQVCPVGLVHVINIQDHHDIGGVNPLAVPFVLQVFESFS